MHEIERNSASASAPSPQNWGQLLDLLENGDGLHRRVVTAVRFDGVAVPTFRTPNALARTLRDTGPIEVETTTVGALLRESAQAAKESIAPLCRAIGRIAGGLRSPDRSAATRDLPQLTRSLRTLTLVTAMLANADESAGAHRHDFDLLVKRMCTVVDHIIEQQAGERWLAVADVLESELAPALDDWASLLEQACAA